MKSIFIAATVIALTGCNPMDGDTYTLYRSSLILPDARLHVASFDAGDGEAYNHETCIQAQGLFQSQPGVKTKFWCEKGGYRK